MDHDQKDQNDVQTVPLESEKKKKKRRKKKHRNKNSMAKKKRETLSKIGRGHASYGSSRPNFGRRESRPHHATVNSLASIKSPIVVKQLTKMSQDLKYHRELQKALMELKQKDEDYRYAIEIGESLTKENQYLKEQIELIESSLHSQEADNVILREKLETLSSTYNEDIHKYHIELQEHKELVQHLTNTIQNKENQINAQKHEIKMSQRKSMMNVMDKVHDGGNNMDEDEIITRMTSDDIENLTSNDFTSSLEKRLFQQIEKEQNKQKEQEKIIENWIRKYDEVIIYKKKYNELQNEYKSLQQMAKDELAQHIQMQKSVEQEAIYLAARKANLEEEREDLLNLLDQRDYEITMLQQQITLQQKQQTRTQQSQTITNQQEASLFADMNANDGGDDDNYHEYYGDMDGDNVNTLNDDNNDTEGSGSGDENPLSDADEIDMIAQLLEDDDFIDDEVFESDDDDDEVEGNMNNNTNTATPLIPTVPQRAALPQRRKEPEKSKDEKAFDKIKEYLHLTASAVKIKYPTVRNIQSDELIKRVKELPFYKYHDQMVRIMETHLKKMRDQERKEKNALSANVNDSPSANSRPPNLQKRRSFLSIFNIFSGTKPDDEDEDEEKKKTNDDNDNDQGITNRRGRGRSGANDGTRTPKKRRSKSKKRKKRKSKTNILDDDSGGTTDDNTDQNQPQNRNRGGSQFGQTRYRRGVSVQASQKRLKNM